MITDDQLAAKNFPKVYKIPEGQYTYLSIPDQGGDVAEPSSNFSWLNDIIDSYAKDREAKRAASSASAEREFRERQSLREMDFALARDRLALFGGQAGGNFNPGFGTLGPYPMSENAANKRVVTSQMQDWFLPIVLLVGAVGLFAAFKK